MKWISVLLLALGFSTTAQAVPNPAAKMCVQLKGEYISEGSLCKFGDGLIGAWTLFRQVGKGSKGNQEAVDAFMRRIPIKRPIPADAPDSEQCAMLAGKLEGKMCKFSDGSEIEMETLKGGLDSDKFADLKAALEKKDQVLEDGGGLVPSKPSKKAKAVR